MRAGDRFVVAIEAVEEGHNASINHDGGSVVDNVA